MRCYTYEHVQDLVGASGISPLNMTMTYYQDNQDAHHSERLSHSPLGAFSEPIPDVFRVVVVDDDALVLRALKRVLSRVKVKLRPGDEPVVLQISEFTSPKDALSYVENNEVGLVVTDQVMPQMHGLDLLHCVRLTSPLTVGILLTGEYDLRLAIAAVNSGDVFRFLNKPWGNEELVRTVEEGVGLHLFKLSRQAYEVFVHEQNSRLAQINDELEQRVKERTQDIEAKRAEIQGLYKALEGSFDASLDMMVAFMRFGDRHITDHGQRTSELVEVFAQYLGLAPSVVSVLSRAATLHWVGLMRAPETLFDKPLSKLNVDERASWDFHPVIAQQVMHNVPALTQCSVIVGRYLTPRSRLETFLPSYTPPHTDEEVNWDDALFDYCAQVLYISSAFERERARAERLKEGTLSGCHAKALKSLGADSDGFFDPDLVELFCKTIEDTWIVERREIQLDSIMKLKPGMVLARPIEAINGVPIAPAGAEVNHALIERLVFVEDSFDFWFHDIYVWS